MNKVYLLHISTTCGHSQGGALQRIYHKNLWTKAYMLDTNLDYLKPINAQQANVTHTYIYTNGKLHRTNSAIWFNEMC